MVPADDQAIVFPWASVMVIMVLLKVAFTCATPEAMFLRSRRRTRAGSFPIPYPLESAALLPHVKHQSYCDAARCAAGYDIRCQRVPTSSCPQSAWPAPYACEHWYGSADREPASHGDASTHGSNQDP